MFRKKKKIETGKLTLEKAMEIAKKKYPEKYEEVDFGGQFGVQMVDRNTFPRTRYAYSLYNGNI